MTPDADRRSVVDMLPARAQVWARLARLDRPIGTWLLFWPCAWGVLLAGEVMRDWYLIPLFFVGSLAMRSAGCVYNDIIDRDLDAQVERTKDRPLASGRIGVRGAWVFLIGLCLIGLLVLIQLNRFAGLVALAALLLVAAYPFMKRITWWPQAWLGLTFNWGALVGYAAATGELSWGAELLYLAGVFWTLGYDTIYALQDAEDDALAGIKSSARALGSQAETAIQLFYMAFGGLLFASLWLVSDDIVTAFSGAGPAVFAGGLVANMVKNGQHHRALKAFRANIWVGLASALGIGYATLI
ncbi:MAG: 4-hydroxybenzoate octaprenyltransferase [Pacificimonas sp.]